MTVRAVITPGTRWVKRLRDDTCGSYTSQTMLVTEFSW